MLARQAVIHEAVFSNSNDYLIGESYVSNLPGLISILNYPFRCPSCHAAINPKFRITRILADARLALDNA